MAVWADENLIQKEQRYGEHSFCNEGNPSGVNCPRRHLYFGIVLVRVSSSSFFFF